jgi:diacylglycerol kinase family enzyme
MLRYRNTPVALAVDGRPVGRYRVRSVAVANGRFFGSGLKVAPHARPNDGKLDTVVVGDLSRTGFVRHIGKLYAGTHLALDEVHAFRGRTVTATSDEEVRLDIDGEPIGRLPATFEVRPAALRVLCGETAAF